MFYDRSHYAYSQVILQLKIVKDIFLIPIHSVAIPNIGSINTY